jgi:hypothetical protein
MALSDFRLAYEAGDEFIRNYLFRYSEEDENYEQRLRLAHCPAYAKALINEVKSKLASQLHTISRTADKRVMDKYAGLDGGVDGRGSSFTSFLVSEILPELLVMGKVGVYIENEVMKIIKAERIEAVAYENRQLKSLSFSDEIGQHVFTTSGLTISYNGEPVTELPGIPCVIFNLKQSLMHDIWRHQVVLMNMEVADTFYVMEANFPHYTRQRDMRTEGTYKLPGDPVKTGVTKGETYDKELDRPGYVHPSPDPLYASMRKEDQIKDEMAKLIDVSISELGGEGVDSGLAAIAAELERGESQLGDMYSKFLLCGDFTVKYPTVFTIRTREARLEEAEKQIKLMAAVPSTTFRKEVCKQAVRAMLLGEISAETISSIEQEIDNLPIVLQDPETLVKHIDAGIIDRVTGAIASGYTAECAVKANEEYKDRMQHILLAQSTKADVNARVGGDEGTGDKSAKNEKRITQDKGLKA